MDVGAGGPGTEERADGWRGGTRERPRAYDPDGRRAAPRRQTTPGWDMGPERRIDDGRTMARALGWFSIGLGLLELAAPRQVTDFLGLEEDHENLVRLYGGRELASGVAILAERTPTAGMWSRVGGDLLDLGTLGMAMARGRPRRDRVMMAMAMVGGIAVLDAMAAKKLSEGWGSNGRTA